MSHCGGVPAVGRSVSPGSLKRKRGIADYTSSRLSQRAKLAEAAPSNDPRPAGDFSSHEQYPSPDSDEPRRTESATTSLLNKAASSAFGHTPQAAPSNKAPSFPNGLTPLTNHSDSSPAITCSPRAVPDLADMSAANVAHEPSDVRPSDAPQTSSNPRAERPSMHLPFSEGKGYRATWDPALDDGHRKSIKAQKEKGLNPKASVPTMKVFEAQKYFAPLDPRLAIPGYTSGICRPRDRISKAINRIAPYNLAPFKTDKNSVGPGEAQQVVVLGFDPFLPESTLRLNFEQFGSIASVQSMTDPATGSFLGIASIKYRDTFRDGIQYTAAVSAKQAEAEFNGHRIGQSTVKVEVDCEGRRCKRYVESALRKARIA